MGDRANIVVRADWPNDLDDREAIFLYSHWGGSELPEVLRKALERGRGRWTDESYLARIIFCEMVADDEQGETGFGISSRLTDNEYDLLVLYQEHVYRVPEHLYVDKGLAFAIQGCPCVSFNAYCATEARNWDDLGIMAT